MPTRYSSTLLLISGTTFNASGVGCPDFGGRWPRGEALGKKGRGARQKYAFKGASRVLFFNERNPTGSYTLDANDVTELRMLEHLLILERWESPASPRTRKRGVCGEEAREGGEQDTSECSGY